MSKHNKPSSVNRIRNFNEVKMFEWIGTFSSIAIVLSQLAEKRKTECGLDFSCTRRIENIWKSDLFGPKSSQKSRLLPPKSPIVTKFTRLTKRNDISSSRKKLQNIFCQLKPETRAMPQIQLGRMEIQDFTQMIALDTGKSLKSKNIISRLFQGFTL